MSEDNCLKVPLPSEFPHQQTGNVYTVHIHTEIDYVPTSLEIDRLETKLISNPVRFLPDCHEQGDMVVIIPPPACY